MAPDDPSARDSDLDILARGHLPPTPRAAADARHAPRRAQPPARAARRAARPPARPRRRHPGARPRTTARAGAAPGGTGAAADAAEAALEDFLRALTADTRPPPGGAAGRARRGFWPSRARRRRRPARRPPATSTGLPGVGPGLVWALERAGLRRLADLAPLAPAELAARLGPLGRLVPAERWIAAARAAG